MEYRVLQEIYESMTFCAKFRKCFKTFPWGELHGMFYDTSARMWIFVKMELFAKCSGGCASGKLKRVLHISRSESPYKLCRRYLTWRRQTERD